LLEVVSALHATTGLSRGIDRGQQKPDENTYNRDYYQELDESKSSPLLHDKPPFEPIDEHLLRSFRLPKQLLQTKRAGEFSPDTERLYCASKRLAKQCHLRRLCFACLKSKVLRPT
jgi:hypothetical protein